MTVCVFLEASKMFHSWVGLKYLQGRECRKRSEGCTPLSPVCPVEQQVRQPQWQLKEQLLVSCTWLKHRHYYWGLRLEVVSIRHTKIPALSMCDEWNAAIKIDFHLFIFQTLVFLTWTVNRKLRARVAEKMSLSSCKLNLFNLCLTDLLYCIFESIRHTSDRCDVENSGFQKKNKNIHCKLILNSVKGSFCAQNLNLRAILLCLWDRGVPWEPHANKKPSRLDFRCYLATRFRLLLCNEKAAFVTLQKQNRVDFL